MTQRLCTVSSEVPHCANVCGNLTLSVAVCACKCKRNDCSFSTCKQRCALKLPRSFSIFTCKRCTYCWTFRLWTTGSIKLAMQLAFFNFYCNSHICLLFDSLEKCPHSRISPQCSLQSLVHTACYINKRASLDTVPEQNVWCLFMEGLLDIASFVLDIQCGATLQLQSRLPRWRPGFPWVKIVFICFPKKQEKAVFVLRVMQNRPQNATFM